MNGSVSPHSRKVHRSRHQFLTRAAFPQDQHRIGVLTHFFDDAVHLPHPRRRPDQPPESRARAQRLPQDPVFLVHIDHPDHPVDLAAQLRNVKRLGDVIRRAQPRRFHRAFDGPVLRQHQHRGLRKILPHPFQQLQPAHLWHAQVRNQNFHRPLVQDFQRLLGGRSRPGSQPGIVNHVAAQISRRVLIINNQNGRRRRPLRRHRCPQFSSRRGSHKLLNSPDRLWGHLHNSDQIGTDCRPESPLKAGLLQKATRHPPQSNVELGFPTSSQYYAER